MPEDIPGGDMSACMDIMQEQGHDEDSAGSICQTLAEEAKADNGNVDQLRDALETGRGLIADVGVDLVSGVDVPAVDSKWVMIKSGGGRRGHDYRVNTAVVLSKEDTEKRISYAAAMIPREPDKEGDVVATPTVEQAAHKFLQQDGGVDTDHSLIEGEGEVVESWVLKEPREFDLPADGGTQEYPAGTWMAGIKWGADAWERIKAGELTGLSIYGQAEHVPLEKAAEGGTPKSGDGQASPEATPMGDSDPAGEGADGDGTDDGPTLKDLQSGLNDLRDTVDSLAEKVEGDGGDAGEQTGTAPTEKGDMWDVLEPAAEDLASMDGVDLSASEIEELLGAALEGDMMGDGDGDDTAEASAEKDVTMDYVVELLAEAEAVDAGADEVKERIGPLFGTGGDPDEIENESDDDEDEDEEDKTAKDADESTGPAEAYLGKGHGTGGDTAAVAKDTEPTDGGLPSYREIAEETGGL